jgi:hypothetical protein
MPDIRTLNANLDKIRRQLATEASTPAPSAALAGEQELALGYVQDFLEILSMHGGLDLRAGNAIVSEFEGYLEAVRIHGGRIQHPAEEDTSVAPEASRWTKILFLDIDGVLNSERTCGAFNGRPHSFTGKDLNRFDWVAIGLIRALCRATGTAIVLSSSWRYDFTAADVSRALGLNIIDITPKTNGRTRGYEVALWLEQHPHVQQYAILDDIDAFEATQKSRFVKTSDYEGLTYSDYSKLKSLLK